MSKCMCFYKHEFFIVRNNDEINYCNQGLTSTSEGYHHLGITHFAIQIIILATITQSSIQVLKCAKYKLEFSCSVFWTGTSTWHFSLSQILSKSAKNQGKLNFTANKTRLPPHSNFAHFDAKINLCVQSQERGGGGENQYNYLITQDLSSLRLTVSWKTAFKQFANGVLMAMMHRKCIPKLINNNISSTFKLPSTVVIIILPKQKQ